MRSWRNLVEGVLHRSNEQIIFETVAKAVAKCREASSQSLPDGSRRSVCSNRFAPPRDEKGKGIRCGLFKKMTCRVMSCGVAWCRAVWRLFFSGGRTGLAAVVRVASFLSHFHGSDSLSQLDCMKSASTEVSTSATRKVHSFLNGWLRNRLLVHNYEKCAVLWSRSRACPSATPASAQRRPS